MTFPSFPTSEAPAWSDFLRAMFASCSSNDSTGCLERPTAWLDNFFVTFRKNSKQVNIPESKATYYNKLLNYHTSTNKVYDKTNVYCV